MAEWPPVPTWDPAKTDQIMTAEWLNAVRANIHSLYGAAIAGAGAFRVMTARSPRDPDGDETQWETVWQGWYRHLNTTLSGVYSIFRTASPIRIDNVERPSADHAVPLMTPDGGGDSTLRYLKNSGAPTELRVQLNYSGDSWADLLIESSSSEKLNQDFTASLTGTFGGSPLVAGAWYRVRVQAKNGAVEVARLHGTGALGQTWPNLNDLPTSGAPTIAQWNYLPQAIAYGQQLVRRSPQPLGAGIELKGGQQTPPQSDRSNVLARWLICHRAPRLAYQISCRGTANVAGDSVTNVNSNLIRLYVVVNGNDHFVNGQNEVYPIPEGGDPDEFKLGARVRYLNRAQGETSDNETVWRTVSGYWDWSGVTPPDPGEWYEVQLRGDSDTNALYYGRLEVLCEFGGSPTSPLRSTRWHGNDVVHGTGGGPGYTGGQLDDLKDDLISRVKPELDRHLQVLIADYSTGWPAAVDENDHYGDRPGAYGARRQRPILYWAGTDLTLHYGSPTAPQTVALGSSDAGALDLTTVSGLAIGTPYWLTPAQSVRYAAEGF